MRQLLLALLLVACVSAFAKAQDSPDPRPLNISSFNTPFAIQGEFEGEYRIYPDRIKLRVEKTHIRLTNHCPYKGRRALNDIKFSLATLTPEKKWKVVAGGQSLPLGEILRPGDELRLNVLYFDILIDETIDLTKYWLVVQMSETSLDLPPTEIRDGYSFAQSCRDIFTADQYASARPQQ